MRYLCKKDFSTENWLSETTQFKAGQFYEGKDGIDSIFIDYIIEGYGTLNINNKKWTSASGTHRFYKEKQDDPYMTHFSEYFYTERERKNIERKNKLAKLKI